LGGRQEISDKTMYESLKVLNQALMERLGLVTARLNEARRYISNIKEVVLCGIDDVPIDPDQRDQLKIYLFEHLDTDSDGTELKPTPAEKKAAAVRDLKAPAEDGSPGSLGATPD
jgi:hypothetical protein